MKKLSFSMLAAAGLLLVACSDQDVVTENVGSQGEFLPEGYMAMNINLPTAPITRAENDVFDDGLENEYNVKDCALLLFQGSNATGATEDDATLFSAQEIVLPFDDKQDGDIDNITTTYQTVAKIKDFDNNGQNKLYALALINYKEVMSIEDGVPTFKNVVNAGNVAVTKGSKLSAIRSLITNADLTTRAGSTNYFFMTNAVLYKTSDISAAPSGQNVVQLAELDCSKIKEKADDAKEDPAGEVFVERAVAKATMKVKTNSVLDLEIEKVEWVIDNMEPTTYVTRNPGAITQTQNTMEYLGYSSGYFGTNPNYRFVGNTTLYGGTTIGQPTDDYQLYRTYWCYDPQYNVDAIDMLAAPKANNGETKFAAIGEDNPLYCYENTFDVDHQNYKNTTRAVLKVTIKDEPTFYTLNGRQEYYMTDEDGDGKDKVTSHVINYIANMSEVLDAFKAALKSGKEWNVDAASINVEFERDELTGQLKVASVEIGDDVQAAIGTVFKETAKNTIESVFTEKLIKNVNNAHIIREYKDGVIYYEARFKHFAGTTPGVDDLAPWNVKNNNTWEGKVTSGHTDASYPAGLDGKTPAQNYLGRYGMVRNNWYDVEVDKFLKLGYPADPSGNVNNPDFDPEDPDAPNTPDDFVQDYISAKIHVLSWAKRTQSWGF